MQNFTDIFISYGRKESKIFASKLYANLTAKGYSAWFDQNDIPIGVDYQNQIDDGIEKAHNFIFIIAPHAVASPYCHPVMGKKPTNYTIFDTADSFYQGKAKVTKYNETFFVNKKGKMVMN